MLKHSHYAHYKLFEKNTNMNVISELKWLARKIVGEV